MRSRSKRQGFGDMTIFTAEMILAIVALLGCLGGGGKFVISRLEHQRTQLEAERIRYELRIENERIKHEASVAERIAEMRREITHQDREIADLRVMSDAYLRHIAALEALMRAAGIQIPELRLPILRAAIEIDDIEDGDRKRRRRRDAEAT